MASEEKSVCKHAVYGQVRVLIRSSKRPHLARQVSMAVDVESRPIEVDPGATCQPIRMPAFAHTRSALEPQALPTCTARGPGMVCVENRTIHASIEL